MAHRKAALTAAGGRKRGAHGAVYCVKDIALSRKTDLRLGRVNIDIHHVGRHFQHEDGTGELTLHHCALVGIFQRGHDRAVLDIAAIHKEMLCPAAGAAGTRRRDQTGDMVQFASAVHGQQVAGKLTAQHSIDSAAQIPVTGGHILLLAIPQEAEADLGVGQRRVQHCICHKGRLAGVLFKEFHPGGRVVEQVVDRDGRAYRPRARLDAQRLAALNAVAAGVLIGLGSGQHLDPGHAGDRGQCLAAEAQCVDMPEILRRGDLAGGMADKRLVDIFSLNA